MNLEKQATDAKERSDRAIAAYDKLNDTSIQLTSAHEALKQEIDRHKADYETAVERLQVAQQAATEAENTVSKLETTGADPEQSSKAKENQTVAINNRDIAKSTLTEINNSLNAATARETKINTSLQVLRQKLDEAEKAKLDTRKEFDDVTATIERERQDAETLADMDSKRLADLETKRNAAKIDQQSSSDWLKRITGIVDNFKSGGP